jgi:hypothetical protein
MRIKQREQHSEESDEKRVVFRAAFVFADSQTEPLPGVEPAPLEPPSEQLTGDSHRYLLERLEAFGVFSPFGGESGRGRGVSLDLIVV